MKKPGFIFVSTRSTRFEPISIVFFPSHCFENIQNVWLKIRISTKYLCKANPIYSLTSQSLTESAPEKPGKFLANTIRGRPLSFPRRPHGYRVPGHLVHRRSNSTLVSTTPSPRPLIQADRLPIRPHWAGEARQSHFTVFLNSSELGATNGYASPFFDRRVQGTTRRQFSRIELLNSDVPFAKATTFYCTCLFPSVKSFYHLFRLFVS